MVFSMKLCYQLAFVVILSSKTVQNKVFSSVKWLYEGYESTFNVSLVATLCWLSYWLSINSQSLNQYGTTLTVRKYWFDTRGLTGDSRKWIKFIYKSFSQNIISGGQWEDEICPKMTLKLVGFQSHLVHL